MNTKDKNREIRFFGTLGLEASGFCGKSVTNSIGGSVRETLMHMFFVQIGRKAITLKEGQL